MVVAVAVAVAIGATPSLFPSLPPLPPDFTLPILMLCCGGLLHFHRKPLGHPIRSHAPFSSGLSGHTGTLMASRTYRRA